MLKLETSPDELKQILQDLLQATKEAQVQKLVERLESIGAEWRAINDEHNFPTIHYSSDPGAAIVERVTNAIDAKLDLIAERKPAVKQEFDSPRKLVEIEFGVKGGYLTAIPSQKEKEDLVTKSSVVVRLLDSDDERTPTIDVQDKGVGIARAEFPSTIMSLHQKNKINKWYLMGRFGQGGSATYRFSRFSIIISRRQHSDGLEGPEVAFTVACLKEAAPGEKDGQYVYLVTKADRLPFAVKADSSVFPGGTLVRHVNYELSGKRPLMLDVYNILEYHLFDPVLPYWLEERRSWVEHKNDRRRLFGSRDRLQRTDVVEVSDEFVAKVGEKGEYGTVTVRYWVFKQGTDTKTKRTFIDPDEPIAITYLGQMHAAMPKRVLANECNLPNLYPDLVVQVECDNLSDLGRRKILTSSREVITQEGRSQIRVILAELLHDELADIDEQREIALLAGHKDKADAALRRELAELINRIKPGTFNLTGGKVAGPKTKTGKKPRRRKHYNPLPTKGFPSFIRIANTNLPIRIGTGRATWIAIESDAPDDFLEEFGTSIEVSEQSQKYCRISSRYRDFKGGRFMLSVTLANEYPPNTEFKLAVEMSVTHGNKESTFDDWKHAIVVPPYQGGGEKKVPLDVPDIVKVNSSMPFWTANGWTMDSVADVREKDSHVTIYISMENKYLVGMVTNSNYKIVKKEQLMTKYILHMALYAYLQWDGMQKLTKENGDGSHEFADVKDSVLETISSKSLEWAARSILTAITSEQAFGSGTAPDDLEAV